MGGDDDTTTVTENPKFKSSSSSIERSYNNGNISNNSDSSDLKRYLKNFMLFSNLEKESEKLRREQQLSKIVKALMYFENKLRKEQEVIQQQLCEKDRVINRQMHTISNMKEKLSVVQTNNSNTSNNNNDDDDFINLPETSGFCPMCRKKYYHHASKSISTQTINNDSNNKFSTNISDGMLQLSTYSYTNIYSLLFNCFFSHFIEFHFFVDYSSIQSIEYMSSSEEQEALLNPNPFSKARRSKKYTSKKSYKGYLQSRPRTSNQTSIEDDEHQQQQQHKLQIQNSDSNNNNINVNRQHSINSGKGPLSSTTTTSTSKNVSGAAKFSLIMNDIHGIKHEQQQKNKHEIYDDTHSTKINRMHGISSQQQQLQQQQKIQTTATTTTTMSSVNEGREEEIEEAETEAKNIVGDDDVDEDEERGKKKKKMSVKNGNHQSAINNKIENVEDDHQQKVTMTRKYCDGDLDVKQKIATRDDWYISDVDEQETSLVKTPYGNVTGVSNSVLECVNQILLQQSMDDFIESHHHHNHHNVHSNHKNNQQQQQQRGNEEKRSSYVSTTSTNDSKESSSTNVTPPTRSNKRVHFSTKNSMVQITPLPRQSLSDIHDNSTYENQSTYSNEYEPIGSARTYVDMDSKSLDNYKPKLPPKPDNLIKLTKQRQLFVQEPIYMKNKNGSEYDMNESEPDYCSISEIQDNINNSVKIVTAEIHNDAKNVDEEDDNDDDNDDDDVDDNDEDNDDNEYSEIKEVPTHNKNNSNNSSHSLNVSDVIAAEESFEDVPKLPNVYSIVPLPSTPPIRKETPTKIIGHDNYITKSPMKKKISSQSSTYFNEMKKSSLKSSSLPPKIPPPQPPPSAMNNVTISLKDQQQQQQHQQTIKIIDEKFQDEFDWYNLDAEYTKTMDVIPTQIENIEEMYQFDDENLNDKESDIKVEYNLEFEFDKLQQDEVEEEEIDDDEEDQPQNSLKSIEIETNNINDGFTTVIKINNNNNEVGSSSSSELSSTPPLSPPVQSVLKATTNLELAETPKLDLKKKLNYEKFLSESGMLSKSLLGRKKFYAGSFV
jgi:hypothetical protein